MVMGVTYEGEIARVGAGIEPQQAVELICTDPRFLEHVSAKKPNFLIRLFNGAISFPKDWWYGTAFLATRANFFDAEGRAATDGTARTITDVLGTAIMNPITTLRTIRIVLGHLVHYPEFYGRTAMATMTSVALTAVGAPFVMPIGLISFFLATTGAVARAVDNGARSLPELIFAAAMGESDPEIVNAAAQRLQLMVPERDTYSIPTKEESYMINLLKGVLYCVRNPEEFMNDTERPRQTTVLVGTVSSARPRGVMGSIPVGYETNALDVIGDENALYD
ncbi:MAG: hypothetical protein ACJA2X_000157 [Halocynthiibacter sp.]|jgi:hypothetical protein